MTARVVGLDFGGTSIKGGAITPDGRILESSSIPVGLGRGAADLFDRAAGFARELGFEGSLGIGCAGIFERDTGVLIDSPNLPELNGSRLVHELAGRLDVLRDAVRLENDANAAALGEQWLGAGRGEPDLLLVTLGTGVGGGLVLGGELFTGPHRNGGEIGHVVVQPDGLRCGCGGRGHLETLASATAARRRAIEAGLPGDDPGNLERLSDLARASVGPERELLVEVGRDLGRGLSYPMVLLDISCFVIGGGFSAALDVLEPGVLEGIDERTFGPRSPRILRAALGGSAGWIGAARLALPADA